MGAFSGIADELAAIAALQRAGLGVPQVQIVIAGVPDWAAKPASGCEREDAGPRSRPINAAGIEAYQGADHPTRRAGRRAGRGGSLVEPLERAQPPGLHQPAARRLQPGLAVAGARGLLPAGARRQGRAGRRSGDQRLVLGEMAGTTVATSKRSTVQEMVAALPDEVACASRTWSQHDYAQVTPDPNKPDPVVALERALDARPCTKGAHIWVTETGVGGDDPGGLRPIDDASLRAQCRAQHLALLRWAEDPRVDAAFQYTFREDTAYPVGLADAGLTRVYPTYDLWAAWGARAPTDPPPTLPQACA